MSLHHLGIAHFPVLHRQLTSRDSRELSASSPDRFQDNKDVLIERLNDLVLLLSQSSTLEDKTITSIHSEVDHIETLIKTSPISPKSAKSSNTLEKAGKDLEPSSPSNRDVFWSPATPTRSISMRFPNLPLGPSTPYKCTCKASQEQSLSTINATRITKEAEDLTLSLTKTISELQTRREEAEHIHEMLLERAELGAKRIFYLESRVKDVEDDYKAIQSDLRFLRIQLQAIEVQATQFLASDDPELSQSIKKWKGDWERIHTLSRERQKRWQSSRSTLDDDSTVWTLT